MSQARPTVTVIYNRAIWADGFRKLRPVLKNALAIALLGLFLPQVLLALYLDAEAMGITEQIVHIVSVLEKSRDPQPFTILMATVTGFLGPFLGINILILLIIMASYFAMTHLAIASYRGEAPPTVGKSFLEGLRSLFPKGLMLIFWMIVILTFGQFLIFPLVVIGSLAMVVPVLMLVEGRSASRSLLDAILLRYVKRATYGTWNVFFSLLTLAAVVYGAILLVSLGTDYLLVLDEFMGIGRRPWTLVAFGHSATWMYVCAMILSTLAASAVLTILPFLTSGFYFLVSAKDFQESA